MSSMIPLTISGLMERAEQMQSDASRLGTVAEVNVRASSMGEAERKGKAELRRANKNEVTGTLAMQGDIRIVAGVTITLRNAGCFDGRYFVEKITHTISNGYTMNLEIRRVLEGY